MFDPKPPVDPKGKPPRSHHLLLLATGGGLALISGGCYAFVILDSLRGLVPLAIGAGLLAVVFRGWFRSQPAVDLEDPTPLTIETPQGFKITLDARSVDAPKELLRMALDSGKREESPPPGGSAVGTKPPPALLEEKKLQSAADGNNRDDDDKKQRSRMTKAKVIHLSRDG